MRLIDADDLKKTYYRELNIEPGETGACYIAFGMFPRMIDNARTINAEPKRGRWVWKMVLDKGTGSMGYVCSECGRDYWHGNAFNYCPNCGARMEGDSGKVDTL